jgi:DNA-binding CsgD family transcriptional regulator
MSDVLNALNSASHADTASELSTPAANFARAPAHGLDPALLFAAMLDEVEHAMLLVDGMTVLHANRSAHHELSSSDHDQHPLTLHTVGQQRQLVTRRKSDALALENAVLSAASRGCRKLLMLGVGEHRISVAILPLGKPAEAKLPQAPMGSAVLLMLGKRRVCSELPIGCYARNFGLTQAETTVLQDLCKGKTPNEIATNHAVAISTVRTQLASIRAKTHTKSLRELVDEVACLPPLVHALTGWVLHH